MKTAIITGIFLNKYHYAMIKGSNGDLSEYVVILPPTGDLLRSVATSKSLVKQYRKLVPSKYTMLMISYEQKLSADHSVDTVVKELNQIIAECNLQPAALIGVSYGGKVALQLAGQYPNIAKKMLLIVSAHELSNSGINFCNDCIEKANSGNRYKLLRTLNDLYNNSSIKLVLNITLFFKFRLFGWLTLNRNNPLSTLEYAYKFMVRNNSKTRNFLSCIKAETLVIGGGCDPLFSERAFVETAHLIPDEKGKVIIFPHSGHMLPVEQFQECKDEIFQFLQ